MNKSKLGGNAHGDIARNDPGETRARLGVLGSRPPRRGAFGEGRARLPPLRCDPGPGRPEPFLFLRDLPRRGGVRGAPADAPLQALRREEQTLAGHPSRASLRQESDSFRRRLALTLALPIRLQLRSPHRCAIAMRSKLSSRIVGRAAFDARVIFWFSP